MDVARICSHCVLNARGDELACAPHLFPVVFKGGAAGQANLVMASVVVNARPGELVRASAPEEFLEQIQWITAWFRLFQWSSQREKNGLWGLSNKPCNVDSSTFGGCDFDKNLSTEASFFSGNGP